jgi:Transcriptional regulator, AbiEi antitoxin
VGENRRTTAEISRLAARQHGCVTRAQLFALGLGDGAIRNRIRTGELIAVHAGVYAVGHVDRTPVALAHAAVPGCGPEAVLSHDSAAALWGLRRWPQQPEVSALETRRRPGIDSHRTTTLSRRDVTTNYGIRVTTVIRTIIDIEPRLTDAQLIRAVQDARHAHHLQPGKLDELLRRCPRARELIDPTQNPTRSQNEDDFVAWAERDGLPTPQINVKVNGKEVDALFPTERVIVELDSLEFHHDPISFRNDRRRDRGSAAHGYLTVRLIKEDLRDEDAEELRQTLRQRRP